MRTTRVLATLVAMLLMGVSMAADRYVDPGGVCGGNAPCYTTIGAALAAVAVDGETIDVGPGTYTENLVINQPVNLIGTAGAGSTTIVSGNAASEFLILLGANVPITFSQGMVIEGFTLTGDLDGDNDLLMFRARASAANDPIIIRNNVFDCTTDPSALKGIETRGDGNAEYVVIENNQFNECKYSMFLNTAIEWLIQNNSSTDAHTGGFLMNTSTVDQLHDIQILNNTITGTSTRPDRLLYLPGQWLTGIGLCTTVYNVEVRGNTIQDSLGQSIAIGDRGNPDLSGVVVECNDMVNNDFGALNEWPTVVIPIENNYWGAADGPSGEGTGSGDLVSTGYDFDPFLTTNFGPDCPTPPAIPSASPRTLMILGISLLALLAYVLTRRAKQTTV